MNKINNRTGINSIAVLVFGLAFFSVALTANAQNQSINDLLSLSDQGDFDTGIAQAKEQNNIQLEATILRDMLLTQLDGNSDKQALKRFQTVAEQAYKEDPGSVSAALTYAGAIWLEARETGKLSGFLKGLPQKSRDLLESALESDPENYQAQAQLGLWHLDIFRRGGNSGARRLSADFDTGLELWRSSVSAAPQNTTMLVHGAFILLDLDNEDYREEAISVLETAQTNMTNSVLEVSMQERAASALKYMSSNDTKALQNVLNAWLGKK